MLRAAPRWRAVAPQLEPRRQMVSPGTVGQRTGSCDYELLKLKG